MKFLLVLSILLSLYRLSLSQDCLLNQNQSYNILEEGGSLKEYTIDGKLFLNSGGFSQWRPDVAQPQNNALLRFRLQSFNFADFELFVNYQYSYDKYLATVSYKFEGTKMTLIYNCNLHIQTYTMNLDDKFYKSPQWFAIYFEKKQISIYYDKKYIGTMKIDQPEYFYLNMYSTKISNFGFIELFESERGGTAQISDLYIFNELKQEQAQCLLQGNQIVKSLKQVNGKFLQ